MKLKGIFSSSNVKPYFIAEMSGNHNSSLDRALEIVDAAAESGANALKVQTYTPDTMTLNLSHGEFFIEDKNSLWKGRSLYDLYKEAMTPWEWHKPIMERCLERGLEFFSSPFDATAVDFLETLNVPFYKIASFEMTDLPLIKKVASTGKPMVISTGMGTLLEIAETVETARKFGCKEIVLLKCTSAYPSLPENANLATIPVLRETFGLEIGLSDHTMGSAVPVASAVLGVNVIEKHFTLKRADGGVDSAFSMEPDEFKQMTLDVSNAKKAVGKVHFGLSKAEEKSRVFRRSIYITTDVKKGDTLNLNNIRVIRPGLGLEPKYLDQVLGRKIKEDLKMGTPLSWQLLD